jgi:hypothetical protein
VLQRQTWLYDPQNFGARDHEITHVRVDKIHGHDQCSLAWPSSENRLGPVTDCKNRNPVVPNTSMISLPSIQGRFREKEVVHKARLSTPRACATTTTILDPKRVLLVALRVV